MMRITSHFFNGITISGVDGEYVYEKIKEADDFYENHLLRMWKKYIPNNAIVLDIGANLGNHTVFFSKKTSAKKIYSFEPVQINYELLTRNCIQNDCNNVQLFNIAVGSQNGRAIVNVNENNLGNSIVSLEDNGEIQVKAVDNLELESPSFVKIDVEGFEMEVLRGMENALQNAHPILWIEVTKESVKGICAYLGKYNYHVEDYYNFNILFVCDDTKGLSIGEILERNLNTIDNLWQIKAAQKELIKNIKAKEQMFINEIETIKHRRKQLLSDIEIIKQKHNESLKILNNKKLENEANVKRNKQLLSDMEIIKQKHNELLKTLNNKKLENEASVKRNKQLLHDLGVVNQKRKELLRDLNETKQECQKKLKNT